MDPRLNPYSPGAGTQPPELAGRSALLEHAEVSLDRLRGGYAERSLVFHGLRGVGKTVLLNRIRTDAEDRGLIAYAIEAPEDRSLPSLLAPALRSILLQLSRKEHAKEFAHKALQALSGFLTSVKVSYGDIVFTLDVEPEPGLADSGDLETDLFELLRYTGEAAAAQDTVVALFIDEMQYIKIHELGALVSALHGAMQRALPIAVVGAGLPQLLGRLGKAKSYAERLFEFFPIDSLSERNARYALVKPAERNHVHYGEEAIAKIVEVTQGYPYFLQVWGKHCWDEAERSPITVRHVQRASKYAIDDLDQSFFLVRFDRLTPKEKEYMRAMAELGDGPHRSGDIAALLGMKVEAAAPRRNNLIRKGMIYSPAHGDTAFTVPLFAGFMKRIMPEPGSGG